MPFQRPGGSMPAKHPRHLRPALITALLLLSLVAGLASLQFFNVLPFSQAAPAGRPIPFTVSPLLARSHLDGPTDVDKELALSIGLHLRNQAALTSYVQNISRPDSVNYHRFLSPAQFDGTFAPDRSSYTQVRQYLEAEGFTITHTYNHHLLISFRGTVGQVEQAFHVTINNYTAADGRTFYANDSNPTLPSYLADVVQSISGLNNATQWHHPPAPGKHPLVSKATAYSISCPGHQSSYLTPDQTASAYNLNGLYNAGYRGEGQSIALFELDTFSQKDLAAYASCFGHSHTPIQTIVTGTSPVPTDSGVVEVELDAELILSAAPQLGSLKIYEAANDTADYNAEWAQIIQDAVPVVSTSWGDCEKFIDPQEIQQENIYFTAAAAQGQSIFAASGDSGSAGCSFDIPPSNALSAGDPGTQPFVTSVGGTTLTVSGNTYKSETTWNNASGASGGGISQYWTVPTSSWQSAPGVLSAYSSSAICNAPVGTTCRETPDVSLHADPDNGYLIYCSSVAAGCYSSGWYVIGGTSAATPMWAAMMALTNEMSLRTGGFTIGFANPLLYKIASTSSTYASSFHDITTGNDDYGDMNSGSYPATRGYDMATGLGSYNAYNLATQLVALSQNATGKRQAPASTTWYFAEGSVGAGFQEYLTLLNPDATRSASISIHYLFESRAQITFTRVLQPGTRITENVNADLHTPVNGPHQSVATMITVTSGPGIVAERPMYFTFNGIKSGSDVIGTTTPATSYYFPEADTRQQDGISYATYITLLNPSTTQTITTTLTFYTGSCGGSTSQNCPTETITVLPLHRSTLTPTDRSLHQQMAIQVASTGPIVAERPMYFRDTLATTRGMVTGASSEIGTVTPTTDWLFAEGYTGMNFQQYFVLANFASSSATAHIKLEYDNGHNQTVTVPIAGGAQAHIDVNQLNAHPEGNCDTSPCHTSTISGAEITSDAPIVAERMIYFKNGRYTGGTEVIGEPGTAAHTVYTFAEGYTGRDFQEYLSLLNPTNQAETVAITLFVGSDVMQQQVTVKAQSRQSFLVNNWVVPLAQAFGTPYEVSVTVQVMGSGSNIVVERPMYFNYGSNSGGTDIIGYTG